MSERIGRTGSALASLLFFSLLGIGAVVLAAIVPLLSRRLLVGGFGVVALLALALVTRRPKEIFLFGWIVALTLNRAYFIFVPLVGNEGSQGPYVVAADFFLFLLFAWWIYERAFLRIKQEPLGPPLWPWFLPFATVCVMSAFVAERPDWTAYELIRVVRVGCILYYARRNFRRQQWWTCVAALGFAMTVQAALGTAEVVSHRSGALGIFGFGEQTKITERFEGEFDPQFWYGTYRATATMTHPPNLACYFLLTIPVFVCLALTVPRGWQKLVCGGASLMALVGLGCTLSRWPWAVAAFQMGLILAGLTALRLLPVRRTVAIVSLAAVGVGMIAWPMRGFLIHRFTSDMKVSQQGRLEEVRTGLRMFEARPLLGVGLNNSRAHVQEYWPQLVESLSLDQEVNEKLHLRVVVSPQNGFVLILIETGLLGLLTFFVYLTGAFRTVLRALRQTSRYRQAACYGLALGLLGVIMQQVIDFSYWVDPLMYTFTLIFGLISTAPVLENPPAAELEQPR